MEVIMIKRWKQWMEVVEEKEQTFCPKKLVECYHIHPSETWMFDQSSFTFKNRCFDVKETMFLIDDRDDEVIELKVLTAIYCRPEIAVFAIDKDTNNRFVINIRYDECCPDIETLKVFDSIIPVDGEIGEPRFF